jgi:hypothetical protein
LKFWLEFLEPIVRLEAGIATFPPGPGTAVSSKESNCVESPTLIVATVVFEWRNAVLPLLSLPLPPNPPFALPAEVTFVIDNVWARRPVLLAGGSVNEGAFASGCGRLAPLPPNVPFVGLFPPKPE